MKKYSIVYTKNAQKDAKKLKKHNLKEKALEILSQLESNPFEGGYEKLVGRLKNAYSRRINIQHRIVYEVNEETRTVKVLRMWTHYGE